MYKCETCGGTNITQKMTLYVDPTDCGTIDLTAGLWHPDFWCEDCEDSVNVMEQTEEQVPYVAIGNGEPVPEHLQHLIPWGHPS